MAKAKLLEYYIEHDDRMQYKTYRDRGLMIGSGPIEAAHRSVIQQRMKLSGQKSNDKAHVPPHIQYIVLELLSIDCFYQYSIGIKERFSIISFSHPK